MTHMKKKKPNNIVRVPYENYELPKSAEKGGSFIDFKDVLEHIERKPVKKIRRKRNEITK